MAASGVGIPRGAGLRGDGIAMRLVEPRPEQIGLLARDFGGGFGIETRSPFERKPPFGRETIERGGKGPVRARDGGGDVILPRGADLPPAGRIARAAFEQVFEQGIEARGGAARIGARIVVAIQPGEVRQQQPGIETHARAHRLAPVEDGFGHAAERAIGQHLFGMIARQHQRGIPARGKGAIAPPQGIDGLGRDTAGKAGVPHVARLREMAEERHAARRRESPRRRRAMRGHGAQRVTRSERRATGRGSRQPRRGRHHAIRRKPDVPIQGHPPPAKPARAVLLHHCVSLTKKAGHSAKGRCRTSI